MPPAGLVEFEDAETGTHRLVDTSSAEFRLAFEAALAARREEQDTEMTKRGVDIVRVDTDDSPVDALVRFFELRARRAG